MGLQLIRTETKFDFMGKRRLALALSGLVILAGLLSILARGGLELGIDFAGGINVQVKFEEDMQESSLQQALDGLDLPQIRVQQLGLEGDHEYLLRVSSLDMQASDLRGRIEQGLEESLDTDFNIQQLEMVGPKVGSDLQNKALQALFYAALLICIYISGRFEQKWFASGLMAGGLLLGVYVLQLLNVPIAFLSLAALLITLGLCWYLALNFALGALVALIHDVLITVGLFSLLGKEFDLSIVAALLTIIGYSLNDTIVVFDRIRENLQSKLQLPLRDLVNKSVNQTLSRTLLTSGTSLMVILALLLLGGGVIHNFALALFIGILVGTYSSVFVAGSLLLGLGPSPEEQEPEEESPGTASA
ncbi:MAG: protein translocase subunit SecF [Desulfohalobiaceae bacterium]